MRFYSSGQVSYFSGQVTHLNISRTSRGVWLDLALDPFAILALGAHQIVVQLEAEMQRFHQTLLT